MVLKNPFTGQVIPDSKIPANLINPVGQRLMDLLPRPNYSGDPILNLRFFRSGTYNQNKWLLKLDHQFSNSSSVSFSYNFSKYDNTIVDFTPYGDKTDLQHDRSMVFSYTQTLAPNLVNDFKFNHTKFDIGRDFVLSGENYAKEWGFWTGSQNPSAKGSPRILLYTEGFRVFQIGGPGPDVRLDDHTYLRDDLVWVKGTHTLSIGGDFKRQNNNWLINNSTLGSFYFGILDGDPRPSIDSIYGVTGSAFASLLMGVSARITYDLSEGEPSRMRRNVFALYAQDDWKVSPRLTFNLGLRYDYEAPFSQIDNKFLTLNYQTGRPRYAKGAPADKLALLKFPFETDGPNRPYEPSNFNFAPRLGFAFRPFNDNTTVLRGGYGMVYTSENAYTTTYGSWVAPFSGSFDVYSKAFAWPDRQNHFVTVDKEPFGLNTQIGAHPGIFIPTTPDYPAGYVQHWNLSAARELGWGVVTEAGYVGSRGVNLNGVTSLSAFNPALDALVKKNVPGWPTIGLRTKGFNSKYNSLQAKAVKRLTAGLEFLASFTWAHAMAEASNDDVNENNDVDIDEIGVLSRRTWSNADFDVRKRFTFSGTYQLPIGRGLYFGKNWSSLTNALLGGWRLNYILTLQDGRPYSVRNPSGNVPDRICDGNLPSDQRTITRWFDHTCFPNHSSRTVIVNGVPRTVDTQGNASANIIIGPGMQNLDLGGQKEFSFTETVKLQLRLEAFNVLNHPNFIGPSGNFFLNTPTGGRITSAYDNRDVQVAVKFLF
jgi:hypothetical protein